MLGANATCIIDGRYRIIKKIGDGGTAVIFEAEQLLLPRKVAIKVMKRGLPDGARAEDRLLREAQILAHPDLRHPALPLVFDCGRTAAGQPFMVMELIAGRTLAEEISLHRRLAPSVVVAMVTQIADALAPLHAQGIVHRDIKPTNIMVACPMPRRVSFRLIDFGIAYEPKSILTVVGGAVGYTPGYVPIEQMLGQDVDGRADEFALACTIYEALTGTRAFPGGRPTTTPAPLGIPGLDAVDQILRKALALEADDRFATVTEFAHEFATAVSRARSPRQRPPGRPRWATTAMAISFMFMPTPSSMDFAEADHRLPPPAIELASLAPAPPRPPMASPPGVPVVRPTRTTAPKVQPRPTRARPTHVDVDDD